ncbi:MAG: DUF261 family protein [Treponema sp.]|nr:DUF261 family protein [Treponema sp.]
MEQQVTTESRQRVAKTLGEYGCYFLSVVKLAEEITGRRIDAIAEFVKMRERKYLDDEATMLNPDGILSDLTGKRFSLHKESADYQTARNEHEILLFANGKYQHFVLGNGRGEVIYDPLGKSNTVANGTLIGKRIFTPVA